MNGHFRKFAATHENSPKDSSAMAFFSVPSKNKTVNKTHFAALEIFRSPNLLSGSEMRDLEECAFLG